MAKTSIEWATDVWNPTTGCDRTSPGCDHCYALTLAKRLKGMGSTKYQTDGDPRTSGPGFGVAVHPDALDVPLRWTKPRKVFVNSMSDLFHDKVPDEFIAEVFAVMALASQHIFQLLTKRHARMRSLLRSEDFAQAVNDAMVHWAVAELRDSPMLDRAPNAFDGPLPNLWLGVSTENQHWANIRIPALLDTPAAVRWVSAEPLLGPVDLRDCNGVDSVERDWSGGMGAPHPLLNWIVCGGESGPNARPMHPDWARSLRDQCQAADVPFFLKQWGEWGPAPWSVRIPNAGDLTKDELAAAKADAEARGATHCLQTSGHLYQPDHKPWSMERDPDGDYPGAIRRWGKKAAGRELDGRTHDAYPAVTL